MTFLALVATAADSEKGREGIGDALQNTAIKNDASPKECTVSKAIKPEYEHNRFAYNRLSALFQAGKQIQQNGAGNSQRCFVIFLSFGSLDPLAPILHLPVDLSVFYRRRIFP